MRVVRGVCRAILLGTAALTATSCATSGLSFRQDDRFSWVNPKSGAEVTLPFELDWEMEGYDGLFAVFVDGIPMRPGDTLLDMVPDAHPCRSQPTCPDEDWLADEDIFVTADTSVVIDGIRDGSGSRSDRDPKEITIVLLDDDGKRTDESAFVREITIDRSDGS